MKVIAVHSSPTHTLSKNSKSGINLLSGIGVEGDAHAGKLVKHQSRVRQDPSQPNLRQVHLIQSELFEELREKGFEISPGMMGENITTSGIDLLALPKNSILIIGSEAQIKITGLRNPSLQLDGIQEGLMKAVLDRNDNGALIRKAGVMGIVINGGIIKPGNSITIEFPNEPFNPLERV